MKGLGNAFSWILLAVALAVPAFMFWNWFQRFRSQGSLPEPAPASGAGLSKMFSAQGDPAAGPQNPMRSALTHEATDQAAQAPGAGAAPSQKSVPASGLGPPAGPSNLLAQGPRPASDTLTDASTGTAREDVPAAASSAPVGAPSAPKPEEGAPQGLRFEPKTVRDPLVSPFEIAELKRLEEERERARLLQAQVVEGPGAVGPVKPPPPLPPGHGLKLEGIVSVGGVRFAYLNGKQYKKGDVVKGARILEIGSNAVTFSQKGKTFKKSMR